MKKLNKKHLVFISVILFLIIGVLSFYVYDKFYATLECGEKSYATVDEVGREYCVFTDQVTIQFKTEITYSEAVEIVTAIEGASIDDTFYKRRDENTRREYYSVQIPAQTQQEQEVIVNKLYEMNSNIKSITPVSHAVSEGPYPF